MAQFLSGQQEACLRRFLADINMWNLQRLRTISSTLRFRLMAWNVVIVLLTATVTLASLREGVRYALYHELDQLHVEDSQQIALMLKERPIDYADLYQSLQQHADGHRQHGWFVVLFNENGQVQWSSKAAPDVALDPHASAPNGTVTDGTVTEIEDLRYLYRRFDTPAESIAAIHVGSHLQSIYRDMARVDRQVALAVGMVLLLAPPTGYWLAGRATRPLSDMMQASVSLRPSRLEERLPLRGTRDELDQLAGTINTLLDRIAVHLEQKHDFLANAAHELRTPLAAIRSSIEVTLNEPRSPQEYEELLDELIEENIHLENLVNQLLLLSETEVEGRTDHSREIDLSSVVLRSVEMFRGVAQANSLTLSTKMEPCQVRGNLDHLRQVVNNLLDNAIKFTPPGGRIEVTVGPSKEGEFAELIVADSGRGIPEGDHHRVFDRFYRSDRRMSDEQTPRGTGLGLSICAAVVAAHQGTIHLESESGVGTTFKVRIPRSFVPRNQEQSNPQSPSANLS